VPVGAEQFTQYAIAALVYLPTLQGSCRLLPPMQWKPAVHGTPLQIVQLGGHHAPMVARHDEQLPAPPVEYLPAGQTLGADAPPGQELPAGHATPDALVNWTGQ
jgi:hypothetical protein